MSDKKWLLGLIGLLVLFVYLFSRFALANGSLDRVVQQLRGDTEAEDHDYHVVLIEQEKDHPYWQMVEKGAADAAGRSHRSLIKQWSKAFWC